MMKRCLVVWITVNRICPALLLIACCYSSFSLLTSLLRVCHVLPGASCASLEDVTHPDCRVHSSLLLLAARPVRAQLPLRAPHYADSRSMIVSLFVEGSCRLELTWCSPSANGLTPCFYPAFRGGMMSVGGERMSKTEKHKWGAFLEKTDGYATIHDPIK